MLSLCLVVVNTRLTDNSYSFVNEFVICSYWVCEYITNFEVFPVTYKLFS
jgi:hypothetical protein